MLQDNVTTIRRRRVFYIPGYDPFPPRRYRELYRKESAVQAAISGYEVTLKPGNTDAARFGWQVDAKIEGVKTHSDFEVLVWSDLVQDSMASGILATYTMLIKTAWIYISTGALWRLMRLRKGPVIAALYPVMFLLVQLFLALLVAYGLGRLALLVLPWWGAFLGLGAVPLVLGWFKARDNRFFAYYLMHDYAYSAASLGANPPALEERMAVFAARIQEALQEDLDEVLVVGHSSGAHLAISVLSDLIRQGHCSKDGPALSFLSLGQVVPMVSFLPRAGRLRRDLAFMSQRQELYWLDVTAPGDGCSFALCDPVAVTGVAPIERHAPLVISAAFSKTLSAARWKALRWRFFRLHFQYLCAFDRPGDYDYFRITAGPQRLADRFQGRKASASRIEMAVNKFTDLAQ